MSMKRFLLAFFAGIILFQGFDALAQEARSRFKVSFAPVADPSVYDI